MKLALRRSTGSSIGVLASQWRMRDIICLFPSAPGGENSVRSGPVERV
jgi:hypothetical protein